MADPDKALIASAAEVEAAQKAMGCERITGGLGPLAHCATMHVGVWTDRGCPVAVAVADAVVAAAQPRIAAERETIGRVFPADVLAELDRQRAEESARRAREIRFDPHLLVQRANGASRRGWKGMVRQMTRDHGCAQHGADCPILREPEAQS